MSIAFNIIQLFESQQSLYNVWKKIVHMCADSLGYKLSSEQIELMDEYSSEAVRELRIFQKFFKSEFTDDEITSIFIDRNNPIHPNLGEINPPQSVKHICSLLDQIF